MAVIRIDRFDDPRLDDYRSLTDAELLRRRNLLVGEGRLVVSRLVEDGHALVSVLVNEASRHAMEETLARLPGEVPVYLCDAAGFRSITGFNLHRGCLALAKRPAPRRAADVVGESELLLVLEGVTDADNIGSAFRNAAAFGAGVLLSPACCDPLYRKAIRTSMAGVLRCPYAWLENWPGDLAGLKERGFTLVALTPQMQALDLASFARAAAGRRVAVVAGSEGPGLTPAVQAMADARVRIPIAAGIDSLNVATATGIALHYFARVS